MSRSLKFSLAFLGAYLAGTIQWRGPAESKFSARLGAAPSCSPPGFRASDLPPEPPNRRSAVHDPCAYPCCLHRPAPPCRLSRPPDCPKAPAHPCPATSQEFGTAEPAEQRVNHSVHFMSHECHPPPPLPSFHLVCSAVESVISDIYAYHKEPQILTPLATSADGPQS
jgi:hypothetical protein